MKCGGKTVRKRMRPGRTIRYRNMNALAVPEDIPIPTCSRCHAEYIDAETAAALEEALRAAYRRALQQRARQAIDIVTSHISQRRLELLLGLSQGYLSRLRAGAGNPSPELVSHLALIAHDPAARLQELERYWAHPDGLPEHPAAATAYLR
ncbi:MAG TPA: hypothetical protein PLW65_16430 [Pseudomonadota bacterium]|nr:hypothetical protein [Pseudomonadota bacterium]